MSTNHNWKYKGQQGPEEDGEVGHYWVCTNCDTLFANWQDDSPPGPGNMTISRDRKRMLTCKEKMVENIQDA